ncbi:MAG: biotin/lipoyl-binding protein [bacterium]
MENGKWMIVLGIILIVGCSKPPEKTTRIEAVRVTAAKPFISDIVLSTTLQGTVLPIREAKISAKAGGRIQSIFVQENSSVQQGNVVAKIDPTDAKIRLLQAEAGLVTTKAGLKQAETSLEQAKTEFDRAHMYFQGFTINIMTLSGLIIAMGRLVLVSLHHLGHKYCCGMWQGLSKKMDQGLSNDSIRSGRLPLMPISLAVSWVML